MRRVCCLLCFDTNDQVSHSCFHAHERERDLWKKVKLKFPHVEFTKKNQQLTCLSSCNRVCYVQAPLSWYQNGAKRKKMCNVGSNRLNMKSDQVFGLAKTITSSRHEEFASVSFLQNCNVCTFNPFLANLTLFACTFRWSSTRRGDMCELAQWKLFTAIEKIFQLS